jgi:hypothetical protein
VAHSTCPACGQPISTEQGVDCCSACGFNLTWATLPGWVVQGVDLRTVARRQRLLLWFVLVALAMNFSPLIMAGVPTIIASFISLFIIAVYVLIMIGTMHMLTALRTHIALRILLLVLMFAPCLNILILLIANQMATSALRRAGLKVGLMGVSDEQVKRVLSGYRCRKCGYSLIGNTSGICPECGTPVGASASGSRIG